MTEATEEVKADTRVWMYGPNDQSQIFDHPEQVPEGWEDHPSKVKNAPLPGPKADTVVETIPPVRNATGSETVQPPAATFVLKPFDDVDKNWVIQQLSVRAVPHNTKWAKQKLYDLLHDAVSPQ